MSKSQAINIFIKNGMTEQTDLHHKLNISALRSQEVESEWHVSKGFLNPSWHPLLIYTETSFCCGNFPLQFLMCLQLLSCFLSCLRHDYNFTIMCCEINRFDNNMGGTRGAMARHITKTFLSLLSLPFTHDNCT